MKPLVEVLREAKERKEAEFQGKWKQMKQGECKTVLSVCWPWPWADLLSLQH